MSLDAFDAALQTSPLLTLALAFGAGLLTSLTPCIYPMIPITAAVVGGQAGDRPGRWRTLALSLSYAIGLATVYALLGLAAGLSGSVFGGVSTTPAWSFLLANLLVVLALMMLDVIPVPVPATLLRRAGGLRGGHRLAGTFAMGAASGVVAAPCGAPVMGALLGWVATTGDPLLGFAYLFTFSLGMTAVLVAVGLSAGALAALPRAGRWMVVVKRGFAILMLGAAEYYLINTGRLLS